MARMVAAVYLVSVVFTDQDEMLFTARQSVLLSIVAGFKLCKKY